MDEKEEKILRLKAELFDIHIQMNNLKAKLDQKLRELNSEFSKQRNDK